MAARTYYEVLGVEAKATREQIRRAYRAAARRLHPDQNPAPQAEAHFRELAEAYQTLNDKTKRREYDARLAGAPPAEPASREAHYSWSNIGADASIGWAEEERRQRRTEFDEMYDAYFGSQQKRSHKSRER